MIGVSGIRGVFGDGLTEEIAERFAYAYGRVYNGTIVVGRDSRISGKVISDAVKSGLRKAGCDVIDLGLATTPTTEMAVTHKKAAGGVIITASHNPREWNGLKFLGPEGIFLTASQGQEVVNVFETVEDIGSCALTGTLTEWDGADKLHIDAILDLDIIDDSLIRSKGYTVVVDAVNGVGGAICTGLLERLGCKVHGINLEPTGEFAHGAEPIPENVADLCAHVKQTGADIGFAIDPDTDRLALVTEEGIAPGEEYTLALAADYIMGSTGGVAACNLSTSRMIDDAALRHGTVVHRSPVGEINVVKLMQEVGAVIGGEGNGGVILPALHHGRDAVVGIALMLQIMAERSRSLSELVGSFTRYTMLKDKIDIEGMGDWKKPVLAEFDGADLDMRDGIKVNLPESWVHVRASNTEPIIRVMAEASSDAAARKLIDRVNGALGK